MPGPRPASRNAQSATPGTFGDSSHDKTTHHFRHEMDEVSREDKRVRRRNVLREIMARTGDAAEQEQAYTSQTGTSRADFFRRKREVETGDFDEQDAA